MSTELKPDQKLRRQVKVYSIEGQLIVTLTNVGISFQAPRTKLAVHLTWPEVVKACHTPDNVPSIFEGRPVEFLQRQAQEATKRAVKKAIKKAQKQSM